VKQFGQLLAAIHRKSREQSALLASVFEERCFFETLRLEPYYRFTASRVAEAAGFLETLIQDTALTQLALVHGDYSPKNILIHNGSLVLLDHEVIHFGDPTFDLGFSLTHFLSKAHHLPQQRQVFLKAARHYWNCYAGAAAEMVSLPGFEARAVRHTLACLLARVAGRSPLEYLNLEERERQRTVVLTLLQRKPETVPNLIEQFGTAIS
jgi:thiamine kinase-like enzyme